MTHSNLFTRDDTFLGVCTALGEDFGFSPIWLRILFGVSVLAAPMGAIAAYLVLALIVFVSRRAAPVRSRTRDNPTRAPEASAPIADNSEAELPLAG